MAPEPEPGVGARLRVADELVAFATARLSSMRLDDGWFCFEVAEPDLAPRGRSPRYTLIVLLGLLRAEAAGIEASVPAQELKGLVLRELDSPELTPGDLGLLLWADSRSGTEAVDRVVDRLEARLERAGGTGALEGLEVSWMAIGLGAIAATSARAERLAASILEVQLARAATPSGLFLHHEAGRRARFPNFATQIYGVLALTECGRLRDHPEALATAKRAADRLLALQRPDGGWPWIFDARRGTVVEPYELYSVHQDAMAPMALLALAEAGDDARYREAALHGLEWMRGRNDLGVPMIAADRGIVYRSIRRRRPLDRALLYTNTATAAAGRAAFAELRGPLELNRTDRPYHLGWLLEAWGDRAAQAMRRSKLVSSE